MKEGKLESKSVKGNLKLESCMLSSVQGLDGGIRRFSGIFSVTTSTLTFVKSVWSAISKPTIVSECSRSRSWKLVSKSKKRPT